MHQGRKVLVVEDNPDGAESLKMMLELCGHAVRVAYDGGDGVRLAREWLPDIVLCDIGLPALSGFEVAHALKAGPTTSHISLYAISGYADGDTTDKALSCGFEQLLAKPADPAEIERLVARAR